MEHKDIQKGQIHVIHNLEFADITERDSYTPSTEDLKKICLVNSPFSYYALRSINPTVWEAFGGVNTNSYTKTETDQLIKNVSTNSGGVPIGTIILMANEKTKNGFLRCNGSKVLKENYPDLYLEIGEDFLKEPKEFKSGTAWDELYYADVPQIDLTAWQSSAFPITNTNQQVIVTKNKVYILGGTSANTKARYMATIDENGVVGTFTAEENLPIACYGFPIIMLENIVYLFGTSTTAIYKATIDENGTLSSFTLYANATMGTTNSYYSAIATKGYIYILGGNTITEIWSAKINDDKSINSFVKEAMTLPEAGTDCDFTIIENYLYFLPSGSTKLYKSEIDIEGKIGEFQTHKTLTFTTSYPRMFHTKNTLYIFHSSNNYYLAQIDIDGIVGEIIKGTTMSFSFSRGRAFATSSRLYLISGGTLNYTNFVGGTNDYMSKTYITNTKLETEFYLPDLEDKNKFSRTQKTYPFIKC